MLCHNSTKDSDNESEDLDQDLKDLIDYDENIEDEGYDQAIDKFLRDRMKQDKEELKMVVERAFASRRKKRHAFDVNFNEDDRMAKRVSQDILTTPFLLPHMFSSSVSQSQSSVCRAWNSK